MRMSKSILGIIFAAVYTVLTLWAAHDYATCKPGLMVFDFCGVPFLLLVLPAFLPLSMMFELLGFHAARDLPLMIVSADLCAATLYVTGAGIEALFRRYFRKFR